MRFQQLVENYCAPAIGQNMLRVVDFAANIRGGWEVWLQVEIYWQLAHGQNAVGLHSFIREHDYPAGGRADFSFVPSNARNTTTWVELKTQRHGNAAQAVTEFSDDIDKVNGATIGANDTAGAIVALPVGDPAVNLQGAYNALPVVRNHVKFVVAQANGGHTGGDLDDQMEWPGQGHGGALVLYYVR